MNALSRWLLAGALVAPPASAFAPDLAALDAVPFHMVSAPLAKRIEAVEDKSQPFVYAVAAELPLGLAQGAWDYSAEIARWRTRVISPGAQTLSFEFANLDLAGGAELWLYDSAGELVQGPYTAKDQEPDGRMWTAVVLGEQAVIELRVPLEHRREVGLEVARVYHGFRGFERDGETIAKSGGCNIDAVCPQGNAWRSEIRSVARITIGGILTGALCTGQLVNNVRQNDSPLFLTADHCGLDGNPGSLVVYWNYFHSICRSTNRPDNQAGNGNLSQNQNGSILLAEDEASDFTLVRLSDQPSAGFNVHFAGWDARDNQIPQNGVSIHHPQGDEKSIAVYGNAAVQDTVSIDVGRTVQAWRVNWTQGTTEQGSSGGGLWNQDHRVVGVLSGGNASCNNLGGDDFFGRLNVAWDGKSAANQQLKAHLDPDNTGTQVLSGKNPSGTGGGGGGGGGSNPPPDGEDRGGGALPALLGLFGLAAALRRRRERFP